MAQMMISGQLCDQNGNSAPVEVPDFQQPTFISSVMVVPQAAPAGTMRTVTVIASGEAPLTYTLNLPLGGSVSNTTGVFQVAV